MTGSFLINLSDVLLQLGIAELFPVFFSFPASFHAGSHIRIDKDTERLHVAENQISCPSDDDTVAF